MEVEAIGTEYYIVLEGAVQLYSKGRAGSDEANTAAEISKSYGEVAVNSGRRIRSEFRGVPKQKPCLKTVIKKGPHGTFVFFDGYDKLMKVLQWRS